MRNRAGLALALLWGIGVIGALPTAAQAKEEVTYDLFLGGLRLGALSIAAERDGPRYRAEARLGTGGLIAIFYKLRLDAVAEGRIGPRAWLPRRFTAETRDSRRSQSVEMRFEGRRPVSVTAEPPFRPKPWEIEPAEQRGTSDPLSAFLSAIASPEGARPCARKTDVFDGRRRHRIRLHAAEPTGRGGRLLRCTGVYKRIAGWKPKMMRRPDFPFTAWYTRDAEGGWQFLRAMGETPFGTAVLRRRGQPTRQRRGRTLSGGSCPAPSQICP